MNSALTVRRRDFLKLGGVVGAGLLLGNPAAWAEEKEKPVPPPRIKTNIEDVLKTPRAKHSLPGPFPGKVVEVTDPKAMVKDKPAGDAVRAMFEKGIRNLTGVDMKESFDQFFRKDDVVGIKVNPVGAGLISTRLEVVDAAVEWLVGNGLKPENIVIWDRFDYMLKDAGFTPERYPGVRIEGIQTMDEGFYSGESKDNSRWLGTDGKHLSGPNFDTEVYYWADVEGPKDDLGYLNQQVFCGKESYFGKLVTKKLTKIINIPVLKNTGNGISVATKNIGYGVICNTNRLHKPLFFDVCTEVCAFPVIRDKLVLNVADCLRAQYDGGPMPAAEFAYTYNTLLFATDPFALDMVCHNLLLEKRKSMKVKVNEHPVFTEYLRYAERLGLGVVTPEKMTHVRV
ncbi:MAG: DUF362 domain-containing protein [Candidatus Eisenbacteria bacterium]|nr:DUF362 domain-containing protein [Candidatus Eisenbacteria bacterium]